MGQPVRRDSTPAPAEHSTHQTIGAGEEREGIGMSVYQLTSEWTDQNGRTRTLESLGGKVQVIALVYTNCGYACPRIVNSMKQIEAAVPESNFVLVSIDPARDTPGRLKEFATGAQLDPKRWTLLNGDDHALLELAAVLGVRYRQTDNGEFVHSNVMTVLDAAGNSIFRQDGFESAGTIAAIRSHLGHGAHKH
jgi:protein SCO1/2